MADDKDKKPDLAQWPANDAATFTAKDRSKGYVLVKLSAKSETIEGKRDATRIFWEWDARHPHNQEVLVVKGRVVKAFYTPKVRAAVANEVLVLVEDYETQPTPLPLDIADMLDHKQIAETVNAAAETAAKAKAAKTAATSTAE